MQGGRMGCFCLRISPLLAVLPWQGRSSNFLASLHSNYVVNLDFDTSAAESAGASGSQDDDVKIMSFAGGKQQFACRIPGSSNNQSKTADAGTTDARAHFMAAKLAPLRGTCASIVIDYWTYDICYGRKIVQHRPDANLRYSLGEHHANSDKLLPSGEVMERYVGGTENRSTDVLYTCGSSEKESRVVKVKEEPPHHYTIEISGAAFCTWKEMDGKEATNSNDGSRMLASSLLEPLRGKCLNTSQGWWTYEYCYPLSLMQFHLDGVKRDPEYTLGTLQGSGQSQLPNRVNMSMLRLKPSMSPRERRAPPSAHLTMSQRLGGGTVCDETDRGRQTTIFFQCPGNWQSRPETQIMSLTESALCEYEVMVQTTLVCGHHKLMPTLPRGKEVIQCVAKAP